MLRLPFLSRKTGENESFLTLDIGTDYVKCLVFEFSEHSPTKVQIKGVGKQPIGYLYTRGGAIVDYTGVKEACEIAVSEALATYDSKPTGVILGLSGDMTKGLVTTVRLQRPEPEIPISEQELSKVISKIQETASLEALKGIAEMTGNPDLDISLTNSSISSVKLDGNYVKDPLGLTGASLEIALFTAFSPSFHLKILQKLMKDLRLKILAVSSQMYSLSKLLCANDENSNMILIDVGGETTDVGIIFGGGIVATRTLSIGGRHVTRAISDTFSLSFSDAEELKLRYSLNNLTTDESDRVFQCISGVLEIWVSGVELLFSDFDGVKTFPSKIYLVGGGSSLPDLPQIIEKEPWTRNIPFKEPPTFAKVAFSDLSAIVDMTGKVNALDDIMPASLAEVFLEMKGVNVDLINYGKNWN